MSNVYKVLKTDAEFLTAALSQSQVDMLERRGDLAGLYNGLLWSSAEMESCEC